MFASLFLENLHRLNSEDLEKIKGFGPVLAKNLIDFTDSDRFHKLVFKLKEQEQNQIEIEVKTSLNQVVNGPLLEQTICLTGTFERSRDDLKNYFKSLGAIITDSMTKKTTILLVGSDPGSKVAKAQELGIMIFQSVVELETKFEII